MHFILFHHLWRQKISNSFNNTLLSEDGSRLPSKSGTGQNNNIIRACNQEKNYSQETKIVAFDCNIKHLFCLHTHKVARAWSQAATTRRRDTSDLPHQTYLFITRRSTKQSSSNITHGHLPRRSLMEFWTADVEK